MPIRQRIACILIAATIFLVILELVRRRKLKEEYSWLWLLTGAGIIVLSLWYELLVKLSLVIGAVTPVSALFLFAFIFLIAVCLQFSINISKLIDQVKNLTQELAMLKAKIEKKTIPQDKFR